MDNLKNELLHVKRLLIEERRTSDANLKLVNEFKRSCDAEIASSKKLHAERKEQEDVVFRMQQEMEESREIIRHQDVQLALHKERVAKMTFQKTEKVS